MERLVLSLPNLEMHNSKSSIDSTTTEITADIYRKKILPRHEDPNAFLFFDEIKDRTYAMGRVAKMFKVLVRDAGVDKDLYG